MIDSYLIAQTARFSIHLFYVNYKHSARHCVNIWGLCVDDDDDRNFPHQRHSAEVFHQISFFIRTIASSRSFIIQGTNKESLRFQPSNSVSVGLQRAMADIKKVVGTCRVGV